MSHSTPQSLDLSPLVRVVQTNSGSTAEGGKSVSFAGAMCSYSLMKRRTPKAPDTLHTLCKACFDACFEVCFEFYITRALCPRPKMHVLWPSVILNLLNERLEEQ